MICSVLLLGHSFTLFQNKWDHPFNVNFSCHYIGLVTERHKTQPANHQLGWELDVVFVAITVHFPHACLLLSLLPAYSVKCNSGITKQNQNEKEKHYDIVYNASFHHLNKWTYFKGAWSHSSWNEGRLVDVPTRIPLSYDLNFADLSEFWEGGFTVTLYMPGFWVVFCCFVFFKYNCDYSFLFVSSVCIQIMLFGSICGTLNKLFLVCFFFKRTGSSCLCCRTKTKYLLVFKVSVL